VAGKPAKLPYLRIDMNYEEIIEGYNSLRETCFKLAKQNNGRLMGADSWLQYVLDERDMTLWFYEDGVECTGMTYTSQTMSDESFCFRIPMELIKEEYARAGN
jgi:hypothetical protein